MKATIFCSLIGLMGIYAGCIKQRDCKQTVYSFEAFFKARPDKDSLKVNDTIWVELVTPVQMKDLNTGQLIDYSGAENFGTAINFGELFGGDIYKTDGAPAAKNFEYLLLAGDTIKSINPEQIREYRFKEKNGTYTFELGIIPKKKGLFIIGPGSAANVYRKKDKCFKAAIDLKFKGTDQHLYLYEQIRPGYTISEYERQHMYCFKVY